MLILSKFSLLGYLRKNVNKSIWQNNKRESRIFKNCLTSLYYTSKNPFQNKITSYLKTFSLLLFSKYKITMSSNFDENHPPISILVLFLVQKKKQHCEFLTIRENGGEWRLAYYENSEQIYPTTKYHLLFFQEVLWTAKITVQLC